MAPELKLPALTQRRLKEVARLHQARERREQGAWLLEGAVLLDEALTAGCHARLVLADDSQAAQHVELLKRAAEAGAELAGLDARAAARLADREHGPALFSVVDRPPPLAGPLPATGPLLLVGLCGLQDPGNVGTLLRSARAFGAHGVLLGEGGVDPGNPKVLRASAGAALGLPLGRLEQLPQWLDGADLALRAALAPGSEERATLHAREERGAGSAQIEAAGGAGRSAEGGRRPQALDEVASSENPASVVPGPPSRVLLLLGHETRGVQSALATLGPDAPVEAWSLRQEPEVESLNVGVAGSILMADWYRRWR